ncbi:hypothetical protein EVA_09939 [gut metagenome]|uniref:Uncharacterized protein n=1 Tax=gut metagenome TaxID=749906 RepID=J9G3Z6_9ZZZZ
MFLKAVQRYDFYIFPPNIFGLFLKKIQKSEKRSELANRF